MSRVGSPVLNTFLVVSVSLVVSAEGPTTRLPLHFFVFYGHVGW
jgi:hypothetical protein